MSESLTDELAGDEAPAIAGYTVEGYNDGQPLMVDSEAPDPTALFEHANVRSPCFWPFYAWLGFFFFFFAKHYFKN